MYLQLAACKFTLLRWMATVIRLTLELLPSGCDDPELAEKLGVIEISNDVWETIQSEGRRGTYQFKIWKKRSAGEGNPWRTGVIRRFPRQAQHPWNLVLRILNAVADNNGGRI